MAKKLNPSEERLPLNIQHKNPFLDADGHPMPGVCCVCGCEEDNACEGGCYWVNDSATLCSSCVEMLGLKLKKGKS